MAKKKNSEKIEEISKKDKDDEPVLNELRSQESLSCPRVPEDYLYNNLSSSFLPDSNYPSGNLSMLSGPVSVNNTDNTGSRLRMYKQDPSVTDLGIREVFIPKKVEDGPKDEQIEIQDVSVVKKDKNNDFIVKNANSVEFDMVHTFAAVRLIVTMYERAIRKLTNNSAWKLNWVWGENEPITVYPHAGRKENACYSREEKALKFFYFNDSSNRLIYTCRSFDIVSHETGHAILDSLCPKYLESESTTPQTAALHEAFGDLTCIFSILYQLDLCEAIVVASKMDLSNSSFLNVLAEQFGKAVYGHDLGLRNAINNSKVSDFTKDPECHALSQVFTGAVYSIIVKVFNRIKNTELKDPAKTLHSVGMKISGLLLQAFINNNATNVSFLTIAQSMIDLVDHTNWKNTEHNPIIKQILKTEFTQREILPRTSPEVGLQHFLQGIFAPTNNFVGKELWFQEHLGHMGADKPRHIDGTRGSPLSLDPRDRKEGYSQRITNRRMAATIDPGVLVNMGGFSYTGKCHTLTLFQNKKSSGPTLNLRCLSENKTSDKDSNQKSNNFY